MTLSEYVQLQRCPVMNPANEWNMQIGVIRAATLRFFHESIAAIRVADAGITPSMNPLLCSENIQITQFHHIELTNGIRMKLLNGPALRVGRDRGRAGGGWGGGEQDRDIKREKKLEN